jgi:hypothetical protein
MLTQEQSGCSDYSSYLIIIRIAVRQLPGVDSGR